MSYKSSSGRNIGKLLNVFQSGKTILGQGIGGGGGAASPSIRAISASGGTETTLVAKDGNNYKVHTFTTVGISTFTISSNDSGAIYYAQLQGGGGGGGGHFTDGDPGPGGGGGGGSGHLAFFTVSSIPGSYSVTVGYGGTLRGSTPTPPGGSGGESSLINPQIIIKVNGGSGGGPGSFQFSGGGGTGGSLLSYSPLPSTTIKYFGGSAVPGAQGQHDQAGGQPGPGGNLWTPIHYNPSNLFFVSPDPVNGRGSGGPGNSRFGGGSGGSGYVKIFYQIPN